MMKPRPLLLASIMSAAALTGAILGPGHAAAEPLSSGGLEVRFCPAHRLWPYPLDDLRHVQGLLLQNAAVFDTGSAATVKSVRFDLLDKGAVVDSRVLTPGDLAKFAGAAAPLQAMRPLIAFQFCGDEMLPADATLTGSALDHGKALLIINQVFAWSGARDTLRMTVEATAADGRPLTVPGDIAIASGLPPGAWRFPLSGTWYIGYGPSFHTGHRWAIMESFAYDIAKVDGKGLSHTGDGSRFTDYYAYGAPIMAMADGRVIEALDGQPEDAGAMRRPDESQAAYMDRLRGDQNERLKAGKAGIAGNHVVIDHGQGQYSFYAHMQPGSLAVHVGDQVKAGQQIGRLGSSGNSTEPHLHVQLCDRPDPLLCEGEPLMFSNVTLPQADGPRALQSGDFVEAQ